MDHPHRLLVEDIIHLNLIKLNILYDYLCINRSCFPSEDLYSFFLFSFCHRRDFFRSEINEHTSYIYDSIRNFQENDMHIWHYRKINARIDLIAIV